MIEAIGMVMLATIALFLARQPEGITGAMPVLGALVIGAQRLLPLMQNSYISWSSLIGSQATFFEVLQLLNQKIPESIAIEDAHKISFASTIRLRSIDFRYNEESPRIFSNINLVIKKGSRIGVIGSTGSGKSTLTDLIMGLLKPDSGTIEIDDIPINDLNQRSWQRHIAHVPQSIFLADATIIENIAFGVPRSQINIARVWRAAEQAQISADIQSWPSGFDTYIGERGIRLSGGQRQRIGIARALYKNADVFVFDEATSALDGETESAVIRAVEALSADVTVIMVAHRLTTLKQCTSIIEFVNSGGFVVRASEEIAS
jgi:ATP-binding cassette subfamily B protein